MTPTPTYDLADLARLFRRRHCTVGRHVHHLQQQHGFPAELPGRRRKKLYSRALVDAWLISPDAPPAAAAGNADADPAVRASRARLEQRFGQNAGTCL